MYRYFCISFRDFTLDSKKLIDFTSLFFANDFFRNGKTIEKNFWRMYKTIKKSFYDV